MLRISITALAATGLFLTGCGDDSQSEPDATPTATATSSGSAKPTDSTTTESTEPEPTVEPATGLTWDLERIFMRAPEGWTKVRSPASWAVGAADPDSQSMVSLTDLENFTPQSYADQVRLELKNNPEAKLQDPVEIAGARWWHTTAPDSDDATIERFGTIHNKSEALIDFLFDNAIPEDERQQIIDSVLATVEWK